MKTALSQLKNIPFLILLIFGLVGCSTDDDTTEQSNFDPITLDFSGLGLEDEDTSFTIQGYKFESYYAESTDLDDSNSYLVKQGLALWGGGEEVSNISLDLKQFPGLKSITIDYSDYNNLMISLYKNGSLVEENDYENNGTVERTLKVSIDDQYEKLKLTSYEAVIVKMHFE